MKPKDTEVWNGRLIAAARALCKITYIELAEEAKVGSKTIARWEKDEEIHISDTPRHGCTSRDVWEKVITVLRAKGVELHRGDDGRGPGVSYIQASPQKDQTPSPSK